MSLEKVIYLGGYLMLPDDVNKSDLEDALNIHVDEFKLVPGKSILISNFSKNNYVNIMERNDDSFLNLSVDNLMEMIVNFEDQHAQSIEKIKEHYPNYYDGSVGVNAGFVCYWR